MLAILHPAEEPGQHFGRYKEKQQAFREDQPPDQGDDKRQRPARPAIVPKYHRETGGEADHSVDEHHGPIGNGSLDKCISAYQTADADQEGEQANESRKINGQVRHANLPYLP